MDRVAVVLAGWGMVVAARGLGEPLLRLFRVDETARLTRLLWAVGLGLGAISLSTLALGACGAVRWSAAPCAIGLVLALLLLRDDLRAALEARRGFRWASWGGAMLLPAAIAFAATTLLGFLPPSDYDVLEYHLGAPAQYLRLGRVAFLPWNVYSCYPENAEMLFTCLLSIFRSSMHGAMAGAVMNAALGVACALAVADLARALFDARAAVLAGIIFYAYPITSIVSSKCYVEIEQVLFSILCLRALACGGGGTAMAGVFAGLAMGTKYPAFLFLAAPVTVFLLARGRLRACITFGVAATIALSPWLAKNTVATGNPVHPLLGSLLHSRGWSAEKAACYGESIHPPMPSAKEALAELRVAVTGLCQVGEDEFEWSAPSVSLLVLLAPLLVWLPREGRRPRAVWALLALTAWHAAAWWLLSPRSDRFFYPAVPWLAVLGGAGISAVRSEFLHSAVHLMATLIIWFHCLTGAPPAVYQVQDWVLGESDPWEFLETYGGESFTALRWVDANLPQDAKVMMLGEAETFYLERDFVAATVYDDCPMDALIPEGDGAAARQAFHRAGIGYVLVNWKEVKRLRGTCAYLLQGRMQPGYSDRVRPDVFRELEREVLERVQGFGKVDPNDGVEPVVVYAVRPG